MSPARSYAGVGLSHPVFLASAHGAHVVDADGRTYIDYLGAFGPHLLGHGDRRLTSALVDQIDKGILFGTSHGLEVDLADRLAAAIPEMEKMRFVSTGTEAVMSAVRLARAATGRSKVLKFAGDYHGHADAFLAAAGSGARDAAGSGVPGVPEGAARDVLTVPYNDLEAAARAVREAGDDLAAILVEPVSGNMGVVLPTSDFLPGLRRLADASGALLVYDEVILGFRARYGAAFPLVGPAPDIIVLGKVLGGGLPIAAYGARAGLMDLIAPEGPVFQAGTHAGNPLSVRAALVLLDAAGEPGFYERLEARSEALCEGIMALARQAGANVSLTRFASMWTLFFRPTPPANMDEAREHDREAFARFFGAMLARGVLLAPSPYEAWFLTSAHDDDDVETTLAAVGEALSLLT